ncbi:MAG: hypothetical protein IT456_25230, partial [Planctomycetes bacterium]|nr:hypothetical protein [Planctomycetota bacterium]
ALPCLAQDVAKGGDEAPAKVVSGSLGVDFTTAYFFRGILQEDQGVIAQPWVELGYGLYSADEGIKSLDLTFGLWNSLHDGPTGGAGSPWYESDFYVGLSAAVGDRLTIGSTYTSYYSPNATFGTVQELAFSVGLDDSDLWGGSFSLKPSFLFAFELTGQADAGSGRGKYAQFGIEPSFEAGQLGGQPITISVPVTVGLSLKDYYEFGTGNDETLGYVDVGLVVSSPLHFLPSRMGPWGASFGVHALMLGDTNEALNNDEGTEVIASFGLSTTF